MEYISPIFTKQLRNYLNRDKMLEIWMPSQVRYQCVNLICSLFSENVNETTKGQLYSISPKLIVKELDTIYERYNDLNLTYTYQNL